MFNKSIGAGFAIGLAGLLNLYFGGGLFGAIAFGLGLLIVCALQLNLCTGKIRQVIFTELSIKNWLIIFCGNILGVAFITLLATYTINNSSMHDTAIQIMDNRLNLNWFIIIVRGVLCGLCVQIAVDMFKKATVPHPFLAMLPASAFVLLGANHCVADAFYLIYSGHFGQWYQIILAAFGNVIGAGLFVVANSDIHTLDALYDK